jgi:hypothetical protein
MNMGKTHRESLQGVHCILKYKVASDLTEGSMAKQGSSTPAATGQLNVADVRDLSYRLHSYTNAVIIIPNSCPRNFIRFELSQGTVPDRTHARLGAGQPHVDPCATG